jgi:hypothetical protein
MNSIMQDYEQEYSTTSAEITTLWYDRISLNIKSTVFFNV